MGCCSSSHNVTKPSKDSDFSNSKCTAARYSNFSKSPPPFHPLLDEETVKEVLSETPTVPKQPSPPLFVPKSQPDQYPFIKTAPLLPHFTKASGMKTPPFTAFPNDEPSEEFSEIGSTLSESVSVSASVTELKENNGGGNDDFHQIRQKSPARYKNKSSPGDLKGDKTVGRSPGRRPNPSPQRVRNGVSSGYGRRDSGESSGRRSRSPVMRTESGTTKTSLSRSLSTRKTGKSPGRVGPGSGERARKVDDGKESEDKWPPTTCSESLENPLVSLECFIFL